MPTAASTVVRQGRGTAFPFGFAAGETAWNLPGSPTDGDVSGAVAQACDAIGGVSAGEFFYARDLDGGLDRSVFATGSDAERDETLTRFVRTMQTYVPWARVGAARVIGDPETGDLDLVVGFSLAADAVPADSPPAGRAVRFRMWGAAD